MAESHRSMSGRVGLIMAALVVVGLVVAGGSHLAGLQGQLRVSRQQIEGLTTQNQSLRQQLEGLQQERQHVDERLGALRNQLAAANTELDQARQRLKELEAQDAELHGSRDRLQAQLTQMQAGRDEAHAKAERLAAENVDLSRTVGRLRERMSLLDRDVQQLTTQLTALQTIPQVNVGYASAVGPSTTPISNAATNQATVATVSRAGMVELPPIIVRKEQAGMALPVQGRVVEVNAAHAFFVLDKGSNDGVQAGMAFDLVRGHQTIGRATVVRVRPNLSACDIISSTAQGPIQPGDLAVQKGL